MGDDEKKLCVGDVTVSPCGRHRWRVARVLPQRAGGELYVLQSEATSWATTIPLSYEKALERGWTVERALHSDDCDGACCRGDLEETASEPVCSVIGCDAVLGGPGDTHEFCRECARADLEREQRERGVAIS